MVHQDTPHELRRNTIKLGPVLPSGVSLIDQSQVSLVNQRGGLQRMAFTFPPQVIIGQTA
jgi:hypothetical protein